MMTQPERSGSHEEPHKDAILNLFQNLMGGCLIESAGFYLCLLGDFACLHEDFRDNFELWTYADRSE